MGNTHSDEYFIQRLEKKGYHLCKYCAEVGTKEHKIQCTKKICANPCKKCHQVMLWGICDRCDDVSLRRNKRKFDMIERLYIAAALG